jgi:hypothetical protein
MLKNCYENDIPPPSKGVGEQFLITICRKGDMNMLNWLFRTLDKHKLCINLNARNADAFRFACGAGNLEIVERLYDKSCEYENPIDIHIGGESPFFLACQHGCLPVVEWLYEKSVDTGCPIDIHSTNESAFIFAFTNKHFHVVRWIIDKSNETNITVNDQHVCIECCRIAISENNVELFQLLHEATRNIVAIYLTFCDCYWYRYERFEILEWMITKMNELNVHLDHSYYFNNNAENRSNNTS